MAPLQEKNKEAIGNCNKHDKGKHTNSTKQANNIKPIMRKITNSCGNTEDICFKLIIKVELKRRDCQIMK